MERTGNKWRARKLSSAPPALKLQIFLLVTPSIYQALLSVTLAGSAPSFILSARTLQSAKCLAELTVALLCGTPFLCASSTPDKLGDGQPGPVNIRQMTDPLPSPSHYSHY